MIKYVTGDLFKSLPKNKDNEFTYIFHICNNLGSWGAGFVIPLEKNFPGCKDSYRKHLKDLRNSKPSGIEPLGTIDIVSFLDNNRVCNAVAQDNTDMEKPRLVNYAAMSECMVMLRQTIKTENFWLGQNTKIVAPMFGAGIGGGDWSIIEEFINWHWSDLDVTIYQLPTVKAK